MARRQLELVFIGPNAANYGVIQRFAGESATLHARVRWVRDPDLITESNPPDEPTVWVVDQDANSLAVGRFLKWLVTHDLSTAGIVLVPDGSREHVSRVKAMGGANLLRTDRMTAGAFEQLVLHAVRR